MWSQYDRGRLLCSHPCSANTIKGNNLYNTYDRYIPVISVIYNYIQCTIMTDLVAMWVEPHIRNEIRDMKIHVKQPDYEIVREIVEKVKNIDRQP